MENFGLRAPIRAQLAAILEDYPAGQLYAEAAQNAEDSDATRFSVMLDLRQLSSEGLRHRNLEQLCGPAFILADNGRGFDEKNWQSLQNLNQSAKKDSPREIGRFGMGSRSYFHFTDLLTVVRKGVYVGIDPLMISGSEGWMCRGLHHVDEVEAALFQYPDLKVDILNGDRIFEGSIFRLPLRRAENVVDGLGPEISTALARKLIHDWANSKHIYNR